VSDPDSVARSLAEQGLDMRDGLHIRAFVDHDRGYRPGPAGDADLPGWSSGAYIGPQGSVLDATEVERDLVEHLRRWAPYVVRHGLVVLEAHSVAPQVARRHLGALHSVAFDSYHGYSHQYPVEYAAFLRACRQAGLARSTHCERHYPSSRPFVAVSVNRLVGPRGDGLLPATGSGTARADTWPGDPGGERSDPGVERSDPGVERADGRGLHELLYESGDIRYPRHWCAAPTGWVVARTLAALEPHLDGVATGEVIRVLDYGTGSGLAAIELLKAFRERGVDALLTARGARLELHLADLPSSWFAHGYELLRDCPWTRFHSLLDDRRAFRPLLDVTGGARMDAVMSNMVFHLVPPGALTAVAGQLASVLAPGGRLLWSSPDLGPPGADAVLFHDANRALRARWLELLDGGPDAPSTEALGAPLRMAVARAAALDDDTRRTAALRAERRILPRAHTVGQVTAALEEHLSGTVESRTYEMLDEEILDALLVPSNQREFLAEVTDAALREEVIRTLMAGEVLPALRETAAGTSLGLGVQWTLGDFGSR
jgi:SAM-dependent methyltransferase